VHGTGAYSTGVGPKGPALERFLNIKKKKKKKKFLDLCADSYQKCWIVNILSSDQTHVV
jgi:hypothetical protein